MTRPTIGNLPILSLSEGVAAILRPLVLDQSDPVERMAGTLSQDLEWTPTRTQSGQPAWWVAMDVLATVSVARDVLLVAVPERGGVCVFTIGECLP